MRTILEILVCENMENEILEMLDEAISPQQLDATVKKYASKFKKPEAYGDLMKHAATVLAQKSNFTSDDLDMMLRSHSAQTYGQKGYVSQASRERPASLDKPAAPGKGGFEKVKDIMKAPVDWAKKKWAPEKRPQPSVATKPVQSKVIQGPPPKAIPSLASLVQREKQPVVSKKPSDTIEPPSDMPDLPRLKKQKPAADDWDLPMKKSVMPPPLPKKTKPEEELPMAKAKDVKLIKPKEKPITQEPKPKDISPGVSAKKAEKQKKGEAKPSVANKDDEEKRKEVQKYLRQSKLEPSSRTMFGDSDIEDPVVPLKKKQGR
jgi:hypothetical protein